MSKVKQVNESLRRIISIHGAEIKLNDVTEVDISGSWIRLQSAEGYVLLNPNNILAMIVKGEKVF